MTFTIGVTGANGLLGWHCCARLHAVRCQAAFKGKTAALDFKPATRETFENPEALAIWAKNCDAIIHFAGVNRAESDQAVRDQNEWITDRLLEALKHANKPLPLAYANSSHSEQDSPYGRAKQSVSDRLSAWAKENGAPFFDAVIPHVFGEQARPFYNNVTASFCETLAQGKPLDSVNPEGKVELIHAGAVAQRMIDAVRSGESGRHRLDGQPLSVVALAEKLTGFDTDYRNLIFPPLDNPFDIALFNSYRQHLYPHFFPASLTLHSDERGRLFEAVKGSSGQTFLSTTKPGITRGEHFHLGKIERFVVISGEAEIAMRPVLRDTSHRFVVNGDQPQYVDMPTLWTHNITNIGDEPLVTLFWANEIFDPVHPDTYADPV